MKIGNLEIDTVPTSLINIKNLVKNVYPCPIDLSVCPFCGRILRDYLFAIFVSKKDCVRIRGKVCYKCDAFFSKSTKILNELEKIRIKEVSYELNKSYDISYDLPYYSNLLNKTKSTYCQITLCLSKDIRIYTIVMKEIDSDARKGVLHYKDKLALELLTAIEMKEKAINICSKSFLFAHVRYSTGANNNAPCIIQCQRGEWLKR